MLCELGQVVRLVAAGEERGEDCRVEGLDATAEDLLGLGQLRDRSRLDAVLREVLSRPLCGEALDSRIHEAAGKLDDAFAVRNGEESAQPATSVALR